MFPDRAVRFTVDKVCSASVAAKQLPSVPTMTLHTDRAKPTDKFLAATILRYPLRTLKIITSIHRDARRLSLKRTPLVRHTAPSANPVSIIVDPRITPHVAVRAD